MKKKECPACAMEVDEDKMECPICGYEFAQSPSTGWIKWVAVFLMIIILILWIL